MNIDKNDKLFDAIVKVALEDATENEMASLPSRETLDEMHPASATLDKRVMKIVAREERVYKRKRTIKILTKAAASIAVLFTIGTLALVTLDVPREFRFDTTAEADQEAELDAIPWARTNIEVPDAFEAEAFFDTFDDEIDSYFRMAAETFLLTEGLELITTQEFDTFTISAYVDPDEEQTIVVMRDHWGVIIKALTGDAIGELIAFLENL